MRLPVVLLVVPVTLLAASACGGSPSASEDAAHPPTCIQQFARWQHGKARTPLLAMKRHINGVQEWGRVDDWKRARADEEGLGHDASALLSLPPPSCAASRGEWTTAMRWGVAVGDATATGGSDDELAMDNAITPVHKWVKTSGTLLTDLNGTVGATHLWP